MRESPELQDLYAALSLAQGEIENASKESENPGFKRGNKTSKYADLASVRDAYRIPFAKHGLALLQIPTIEGKTVTVLTRLVHKSGQFIEEPMSMDAINGTPQALGSTITYIRRYAAMCFSGVAPEDDDGDAASGVNSEHVHEPQYAPRPPNPTPAKEQFISTEQQDELARLLRLCGKGTWDSFAADLKVERFSAIPSHKYEGAVSWLNGRLQAQSGAKAITTPPNPNKAVSGSPNPFDFDAYRASLIAAQSHDELNAIFKRDIEGRKPPLTNDEIDEAQNILREVGMKFWDHTQGSGL